MLAAAAVYTQHTLPDRGPEKEQRQAHGAEERPCEGVEGDEDGRDGIVLKEGQ